MNLNPFKTLVKQNQRIKVKKAVQRKTWRREKGNWLTDFIQCVDLDESKNGVEEDEGHTGHKKRSMSYMYMCTYIHNKYVCLLPSYLRVLWLLYKITIFIIFFSYWLTGMETRTGGNIRELKYWTGFASFCLNLWKEG